MGSTDRNTVFIYSGNHCNLIVYYRCTVMNNTNGENERSKRDQRSFVVLVIGHFNPFVTEVSIVRGFASCLIELISSSL